VNSPAVAKAQALLEVNRADDAAAALAQALGNDPGDWQAWCVLGLANLLRQRYREAVDCTKRAIELRPEAEWPHRIASVAELELGNRGRALAAAREAVRLAPHSAYAHAHLANALSRGRPWRWPEAAREANRALDLGSHEGEVHAMTGNVALRMRRRRLAESRYQQALEIDPSDAGAMNNLALVRLRRGFPIAAAAGFTRAAVLDPTTDRHRHNLDSAVAYSLGYAAVLFGIVALVKLLFPAGGLAALALAVGIVALYLVRARGALGPAAWDYVKGVPLTNFKVGRAAVLVGIQLLCVSAFCITGASGSPAFAFFPLLFGVRVLLQLGVRRILS
jgi:tetratricopeptide (TPR) repeat protein